MQSVKANINNDGRFDKYLAFDCETGGLAPGEVSLLTVYFAVLNSHFEVESELYLRIKPNNNEPYRVTAEALGINKINIIKHDTESLTQDAAARVLYLYLKDATDNGKIKLIPVGHNVAFDLTHIWANLMKRTGWHMFVSHRVMDTGVLAQLLRAANRLPKHIGGSLESLASHFQISTNQQSLHDAKVDTHVTIAVLQKMIDMVK